MEIDHINSILDVDEHGNPRFTCSVKPDNRDQWVSSDSPREPLRCTNATETNGDIYMRDNKLQEDFLKESMRPSYSEESSPKEPLKDSDHTEYYNTLREVLSEEQINALTEYYNALREFLSEEQINALTEDCIRLLGDKSKH